MRSRTIIAMAIALTVTGCAFPAGEPSPGLDDASGQAQTPVADPAITIQDFEFNNGTVTIETGTTVTWVWKDTPMEHNVVFEDFESPLQSEGTWAYTFEEAGSYDYHCQPHPFMTGTVTVVEPGAEEAA